jgi:type 1 glutamine amidotransferase
MNHLNPDIHVLLAADLNTIDKDPRLDEYPGDTFGNLFPLAWYHEYDGGREFFTALGHNPEHYSDENFRRHLAGGILWALGIEE